MIFRSSALLCPPAKTKILHYAKSNNFQKLMLVVQGVLNKIANQQSRSFNERMIERQTNSLQITEEQPKTTLQAEKKFIENNKEISFNQKNRLKRIDEILGTNTYMHDLKVYEQRISPNHVIQIEKLMKKNIQFRKVDTRPQKQQKTTKAWRRTLIKKRTNIRSYPKGDSNLRYYQQFPNISQKQMQDLYKFLAEQQIFATNSLGNVQLLIESVAQQRIYRVVQNKVIDQQSAFDQMTFNNYVYFCPNNTFDLFRVHSSKFSQDLVSSQQSLIKYLNDKTGNIELVITLQQIYTVLKQYYFDSRVSQLLSKIQNNQLEYMLSNLNVSQNNEQIFVCIDMLGTKKQYVGIYKKLNQKNHQQINIKNVIFNFLPDVTLLNGGEMYYIQRSQEGMFREFVKVKFEQFVGKDVQKVLDGPEENNQKRFSELETKVIYKCAPHKQLQISSKKQYNNNVYSTQQNYHIILHETQIGTSNDRSIYLFIHQSNPQKTQISLQKINKNDQNLFQSIKCPQNFNPEFLKMRPSDFQTQCMQVIGVGYILIRYLKVKDNEHLKFGRNQKYARFVTLVPFTSAVRKNEQINQGETRGRDYYISGNSPKAQVQKQHLLQSKSIVQTTSDNDNDNGSVSPFHISLPSSLTLSPSKLSLDHQHIIYFPPQLHFITQSHLALLSPSNIYLVSSLSLESSYNRNCLSIYPFRSELHPYTLYLDGHEIQMLEKGAQNTGFLSILLKTSLLPVHLKYCLWKREVQETINERIYTERVQIKQGIVVKVVALQRYVNDGVMKDQMKFNGLPVILHIASKHENLDEIVVKKMIEKGVVFVQVQQCRGIFGTNMLDLVRGSKQNYKNLMEDIMQVVDYIKNNINERVCVYAEGPSACHALLMMNILHNQDGEYFDGSVLNNGVYDLRSIIKNQHYFFGSDYEVFKDCNPIQFSLFDFTRKAQKKEDEDNAEILVQNLKNMLFTSSSKQERVQTRKFINKLRCQDKAEYDKVYMREFTSNYEKDLHNLCFLYEIMNKKMRGDYFEFRKKKLKDIAEVGDAISRDQMAKQRKKEQE